MKFVVLFPE